jgi:hypothetical protein
MHEGVPRFRRSNGKRGALAAVSSSDVALMRQKRPVAPARDGGAATICRRRGACAHQARHMIVPIIAED